MAWSLQEIMESRRRARKKTYVAFIDGESAYCRPPPAVILEAVWKAGTERGDWLAVSSLLGKLQACVKLQGKLIGKWHCETGVLQGGALSQALFESTECELVEKLRQAGCSIMVRDGKGVEHQIRMLGYVDDLALLAETSQQLQRGLNIVT